MFSHCFGLFLESPPSQAPNIARIAPLAAFFVIIFGSSWGPPQPGLENGLELLPRSLFRNCFWALPGAPRSQARKMAQNCYLESFSVTIFGSCGSQPGPENSSELLPGGLCRNCFGLFLGSSPARPRIAPWPVLRDQKLKEIKKGKQYCSYCVFLRCKVAQMATVSCSGPL